MPSVRLANYLQARADGASVEEAAEQSGLARQSCTKRTSKAGRWSCLPRVQVQVQVRACARANNRERRSWKRFRPASA
jgi:hypothetical protein